jgi:hypothetical protein
MEMMKRAGRAHSNSGVGGTAQGELALPCRACPQPGKNLPDGWDKIDWTKMPEDLSCVALLKPTVIQTDSRDVLDTNTFYFWLRTAIFG